MHAKHAWGENARVLDQHLQDYTEISQSIAIANLDGRQHRPVQSSEFQESGADVSVVLRVADLYGTCSAQISY